MSSIKEGHLKYLLFFPLLPLLETGQNCSSPSTANVFGILTTTREPRSTNVSAELKGTRIIAYFLQAFYLQNLTHTSPKPQKTSENPTKPHLTLPFLKPPLTLLPNLPLQNLTLPYLTFLQVHFTLIHLPPIRTLKLFLNSYKFVVCSICCLKPCLLFVAYKFCYTNCHSSPLFKNCPHLLTAVEVRFILWQNVGIKPGFSGLIKIPTHPLFISVIVIDIF